MSYCPNFGAAHAGQSDCFRAGNTAPEVGAFPRVRSELGRIRTCDTQPRNRPRSPVIPRNAYFYAVPASSLSYRTTTIDSYKLPDKLTTSL
jgi:hypothetical protein